MSNDTRRPYYFGLNISAEQVGWAVTDESYNLMRHGQKDLWGVNEFEKADTAKERRQQRISRRMKQRDAVRRGLIRDMFHDALQEADPNFLPRLAYSKYHLEDRPEALRDKNTLFSDEGFTDRDYFDQYKTIFHLRRELIRDPGQHDVRLVYLAVLNLFKHRGNFLSTASVGGGGVDETFNAFCDTLNAYLQETDAPAGVFIDAKSIDTKELEDILSAKEKTNSEKLKELKKLFSLGSKTQRKTGFIKTLCGLNADLHTLFPEFTSDEAVKISFSDLRFDEKYDEIADMLTQSQADVIVAAKAVYDAGVLAGIMRGYEYLSEARVADYEKHREDLKLLKKTIRKYAPAAYDMLFRSDAPGSYGAYVNIGTTDTGKKRRRGMKSRKGEDLYKTIRSLLKGAPEGDPSVAYILREIETEQFLPKQMTSDNRVIPNQVHKAELDKILENASGYLPFLRERDESGLTVSERISLLFSFQIPYFVGPLSERSELSGGNGWVVRKEGGQVFPWNLEEKVDLKRTSEQFIERLVRKCTYISEETVLPKKSLKYERFCVLNELNNIRIDNVRIPVQVKQDIYRDLFQRGKKVSKKKLFSYLNGKGLVQEEAQITGVGDQFTSSLSSYGVFRAILGEQIDDPTMTEMAEDIILLGSIYGENRKLFRDGITEKYGEYLSPKLIKRLSGLKFRDWGNLSEAFLDLRGVYKPTGEVFSIMDALWEDENNANLMVLLHSRDYTFAEELQKKQAKALHTLYDVTFDDLEGKYLSAPVKRMLWQAIRVTREVRQIMGRDAARVFVNMASSNMPDKKPRKKRLEALYGKLEGVPKAWKDDMLAKIAAADKSGMLRSKRVYLYFLQMGKCMYTGRELDYNSLSDKERYSIDHIYPRHFVRDNDIETNLVLVDRRCNNNKGDAYPLAEEIRKNPEVAGLWEKLYEGKLLSAEKYHRLINATPFSDEQLAEFITEAMFGDRQGSGVAGEILRQLLPNKTEVILTRRNNVADFRNEFELAKSVSVNDFHYANDAYLNIVVGNAYHVKFTSDPSRFIAKNYRQNKERYHLGRVFEDDIRREGETAWIAEGGEATATIDTVRKTLAKNTPLLSRRTFTTKGKLTNTKIAGASITKPGIYMPLKESDPVLSDMSKYGGYSDIKASYFFLVEHTEKGQRVRTLETVPVKLVIEKDLNEEELEAYCRNTLGLAEPSVRVPKIRIQSLIKRNGYFLHIGGKSSSRITCRNAVQMCLNQEWIAYVHDIDKYIDAEVIPKGISKEKNLELYDVLLEKHTSGIYRKKPNPLGGTLAAGKKIFKALSMEKQIKTLAEIIIGSRVGTTVCNLKDIGGSANSGVTAISKKVTGCEEFKLIHQSATGVYEKEIDLLTI